MKPNDSRWVRVEDSVEVAPDGRRSFICTGRAPFQFSMQTSDSTDPSTPTESRTKDGDESTRSASTIEGVASSTSVDAYGTEMSLEALLSMSEQMKRGLPILPRHNNGSRGVEWDEVIGRTIDAKVEQSDVLVPGAVGEVGYTLRLTSTLYPEEDLTKKLLSRLGRGESIGQSIGGWFLSVRVEETPDGDLDRVIVENVELDHVAVTRAPANPDSGGLVAFRSDLASDLQASETVSIPDTRSVLGVRETEDEIIIRFRKGQNAKIEVDAPEDPEHDLVVEEGRNMVDTRANPEEVAEGSFVRFVRPGTSDADGESDGGESSGRVVEVRTEGSYEGVDAVASDEDPILVVKIYKPIRNGYAATADLDGVLMSEVEVIDPLPAPHDKEQVDADEDAYVEIEQSKPFVRDVTEFQDFPLAPKDEAWSFTAEEANEIIGDPPDWKRYKSVHLYYEPSKDETRAGYKLPIAKLYDGELRVYFRAIAAAMGAINGARGGVEIDESYRLPIYKHLVRYYELFEEEAPELLSETETDTDRSTLDISSPPDIDSTEDIIQNTEKDESLQFTPSEQSGTRTKQPSEEDTPMTPADFERIRSMIEAAVSGSNGGAAPDVTAERSEPAPTSEIDILRQENEQLRASLRASRSAPIRRGLIGHATSTATQRGARSILMDLAVRSRSGSPLVARVVEDNADKVEDLTTANLRDLGDLLRTVLVAAEQDGILGNPSPMMWK